MGSHLFAINGDMERQLHLVGDATKKTVMRNIDDVSDSDLSDSEPDSD